MFTPTPLPNLLLYTPRRFGDDRGYFEETYNQRVFAEAGVACAFVQDNQARSTLGVLRGMHFQTGEHAQAKLVRVLEGEVYDAVVDLRPDSPTYGQSFGLLLSAENRKQLLVPRGFAHGYLVTSPTATFAYKCDNFYAPEAEGGLRYDDPALSIDWPAVDAELTVAERDLNWPLLQKR